MNMKILTAAVLCIPLVLCGCGTGGVVKTTEKPDEFAQNVKKQIDEFISTTDKNAQQAAADLAIMMESLSAYADERGNAYIDLRDAAQALLDSYRAGATQDEIKTKIEELKAKASAL